MTEADDPAAEPQPTEFQEREFEALQKFVNVLWPDYAKPIRKLRETDERAQ